MATEKRDYPTFSLDDEVAVDGQDTGLTLGDLLSGPGVFTMPTEEEADDLMMDFFKKFL